MGDIVNAVAGAASQHSVTIKEENIAPVVSIKIEQSGVVVTTVASDAGEVISTAIVNDLNLDDVHVYDWSQTDNNFASLNGTTSQTFSFDPTGLVEGVYILRLNVTDNGVPTLAHDASALINVIANMPQLTSSDTDKDGVNDDVEGVGDTDGDRIPDYLDSINIPHQMAANESGSLMQTENGLSILQGKTALENGLAHVQLILDMLDSSQLTSNQLDHFEYPLGIFDFEVTGIATGASAMVVLPMNDAIPSDAQYRKYFTNSGWQNFDTSTGDIVASSAGTIGSCPAPGKASYSDGLTEGHYCVQLTIADGGPNDTDGVENGVLTDPGGVAIQQSAADGGPNDTDGVENGVLTDPGGVVVQQSTATASSGGRGGGSMNLLLLLTLLVYYLGFAARRYKH
jgi:hypothetical protein